MKSDELIGSSEIMPLMESLYRITTWRGALYHIKRHSLPLYRTANGKPQMFISEVVEHEVKAGRIVCLNDLTIR